MDKSKIVAQLYTLREYLKTPEDIVATFKKVKEIGYDAVQVSGLGPIEPLKLKEIADKNELQICVTHIPYDRLINDVDNVIKEHKIYDCKNVGLGIMPEKFRKSKEGYIEFVKEISKTAKILKENGLQFVYHNHNVEFMKFDGLTGYEILFDEADKDIFDFELDTFWVQSGGGDVIYWINKMKNRIPVIHFKDMVITEKGQTMAEVGEGNLNWPGIIEACKNANVEWFAVEQDVCAGNPFDCLQTSLNNLKKFGF